MNVSNPTNSESKTPTPSVLGKSLISVLVTVHLASLVLTYSANWRRSSIQDHTLVALQPYLIGANFYHEMLPVEWISESYKPGSLSIEIQDANSSPDEWQNIVASTSSRPNSKSDRLLHFLSELASVGDSQGLTRVLKSIVLHAESVNANKRPPISRIRIHKADDSDLATDSGSDASAVLYEASIARFPDGDFGFIPKVESNRSVKAIEAGKDKP